MKTDKVRQTNIELLRVLAMSGVIFLHYFNAEIGKGIAYVQKGTTNELILQILEAASICAVDLFVMISGYFLYKTNRRTLGKGLAMLLQVSLYSVSIYFISCILKHSEFTFHELYGRLLPANWFVVLYVALYWISPWINKAFQGLSKRHKMLGAILMFVLFSVWPTIVDVICQLTGSELRGLSTLGMYGSERGYTIMQFI